MKFTVADLLDQVPAEGSLEKAKLREDSAADQSFRKTNP